MAVPKQDDWHQACEIVQHDLNTFARNIAQLGDWIALDLSEAKIDVPDAVAENVTHLRQLAEQMAVFSGDLVRLLMSGTRGDGTCRLDWVIDSVIEDHFTHWNRAITQDIRISPAPLSEPDASALIYALLSRISARNCGGHPKIQILADAKDDIYTIELQEIMRQPPTDPEQSGRWAEYESKTTNLAIATAKKICEAHNGHMHFRVDGSTGDRVMRVQFPI